MGKPSISFKNLSLGYGPNILMERIDTDFVSGELCALIGRNGTGKSTLLRAVSGLGAVAAGSIEICGQSISEMNPQQIARQIAFVSTQRIRITDLKVRDVVGMGRAPYTGWFGRLSNRDREIVSRSISDVGMSGFADKTVDTLSDGESQRVMIARALAQDTPIIILDEPTAFLDVPNRYEICLLLGELAHRDGKTVIFSSHDTGIVTRLCDTVALITERRLYHGPVHELLSDGTLQKLFAGTQLSFNTSDGSVNFTR